jgi:hypothetical protein
MTINKNLWIARIALALMLLHPSFSREANIAEKGAFRLTVALTPGACSTLQPDPHFAESMLLNHQRRVALVVGEAEYGPLVNNQKPSSLNNTGNDATSVANALASLGFTVFAGIDLSKASFNRCFGDFLNSAEDGGSALLYFAGHGLAAGGNTYLLPIDAHIYTDAGVGLNFLKLNGTDGILSKMRSRSVSFLFLDACRDIPFKSPGLLSSVDGEAIATVEAKSVVSVIAPSPHGIWLPVVTRAP